MKILLFAVVGSVLCLADSETKIKMEDLPAAVRQAVKEQSRNTTIRGFTKEVEGGKVFYEAEMIVNGHSRDVSFDSTGKVITVEEETTLDKVPAAARDAIQKAASGATLGKVETVTESGRTSYEATIRKGTRDTEFKVDSSGKTVK